MNLRVNEISQKDLLSLLRTTPQGKRALIEIQRPLKKQNELLLRQLNNLRKCKGEMK